MRILREMMALGFSNAKIGSAVRAAARQWNDLLTGLVEQIEKTHGLPHPFEAMDVSALVTMAFIGGESHILLGIEDNAIPVRRALRRFGALIRQFEQTQTKGD